MFREKKIAFIGAGNMGEALIKGLLKASFNPRKIIAADIFKKRLNYLADSYKINTTTENKSAAEEAEICILAVKPQQSEEVLSELKNSIQESTLLISLVAGLSLPKISSFFKQKVKLIRAMPNTCALILAGITALSKGINSNEEDLVRAKKIFSCIGKVVCVEEKFMDAITGLSGSGPAYMFLFLEALIDGGVKMGLSYELAFTLATQTMYGSAKLALESEKNLRELRKMVTSPAGTTIAGLYVLEEKGVRASLIKAVEAAALRAKELGER